MPGDARQEFQLWGGFSPQSGGLISSTPDRKFAVAGLLYSRRCWAWNKLSISYNAGLIPLALIRQPVSESVVVIIPGTPVIVIGPVLGFTLIGQSPAHSVYGFAATPAGFTFDFLRNSRVYPFLQIDGGLMKSSEAVPYNLPGGTSLNLLLSLGVGVKVPVGKSHAFSFGYKLMHVSNANRTPLNPGLDNNVIFAGISLLK